VNSCACVEELHAADEVDDTLADVVLLSDEALYLLGDLLLSRSARGRESGDGAGVGRNGSSPSLLRRRTGDIPAEDIGASSDSANSAPLAAFLTLDLKFRPFHHLALVVCPRVVRCPRSFYSMLRSQHTLRIPQATHGSQGRPQRSIWGVSIVLGSPRRLDVPPFSRSSYD
jgi:hypothetical protein